MLWSTPDSATTRAIDLAVVTSTSGSRRKAAAAVVPSIPSHHVVVTGASGYVGRRFCLLASRRGWRVTALSRRRPRGLPDSVSHVPYALEAPFPPLPGDVTAVLHLAYDTSNELSDDVEIRAARSLVSAATAAGAARIVFASSQTAANPVSRYGRVKRLIEDLFAGSGGVVVRPGLVYGGPRSEGLFATFWLLARLPVRFVPLPMPQVYPIHLDDLCDALLALCDPAREHVDRVDLAGPPLAFAALLQEMAADRGTMPQLPIPFPLGLVLSVVELGGRYVSVLAWLAERLQSFAALAPIDGVRGLARLGLRARPLRCGLRPGGDARRRDLLLEARSLLRYAGGFAPGRMTVARYVRAIERFEDGRALGLSRLVRRHPGLAEFRAPAPKALHDGALERRLDVAVGLAEATPDGARAFLPPAPSSLAGVAAGLALGGIREAARRTAQLALTPVLVRQARARRRTAPRATGA